MQDAIPWAVSFFLCTFKDIKFGVGIGMAVNILIQLYMSARPAHPALIVDERTLMYRPKTEKDEEDEERDHIYEDSGYTPPQITVMRVGGSLFFSAGNSWKEAVRAQLVKDKTRALVLDYTACAGIDFSGVQAVLECTDDCQKMKVSVVRCRCQQKVENKSHNWDVESPSCAGLLQNRSWFFFLLFFPIFSFFLTFLLMYPLLITSSLNYQRCGSTAAA